MTENIGLIVGHSKEKEGAKAYNGITEYNFNKTVAAFMGELYKYEILCGIENFNLVLIDRNQGWAGVKKKVRERGITMTLELHFNSFNGKAQGTECLCLSGSALSYAFASHIAQAISNKYKTKLRHEDGVLEIDTGDRGYNNLDIIEDQLVNEAIIVEPCFANLKTKESTAIISNPMEYALTLYKALKAFV